MIVDLVYAPPSWLLAVIVAVIVTAYAVAGLFLTERWIPSHRRRPHNDVTGPISALVGVVFALLIAFVAIAVWQQFDQASAIVLREANAAGDVWRQAYGYPDPLRTHVREGIQRYVEAVAKDEWPQLAKGVSDHRAWGIFEATHREMLRFEPKTPGEQLVHSEQLRDMNTVIDQRRSRLHAAREGISPQMWWVLILGTTLTIALTWFFGTESFPAHLGMTVCLAVSIALVIFLIAGLDYPFRGDMAVEPTAFDEVLASIKRLTVDEKAAAR